MVKKLESTRAVIQLLQYQNKGILIVVVVVFLAVWGGGVGGDGDSCGDCDNHGGAGSHMNDGNSSDDKLCWQ